MQGGRRNIESQLNQERLLFMNSTMLYGAFKITIESIRSGKTNVLMLHEGERRDNFFAELNEEPWKPEKVSISTVARIIRKSIVKTRSGRIV